ncbi:hypothetical protein [Mesorhizobium sp. M0136]|uniref:hypothetical protein n=1 Tax=unclassified Mesorhizobium TaxID=325217 RepID=UPI00333997F1
MILSEFLYFTPAYLVGAMARAKLPDLVDVIFDTSGQADFKGFNEEGQVARPVLFGFDARHGIRTLFLPAPYLSPWPFRLSWVSSWR